MDIIRASYNHYVHNPYSHIEYTPIFERGQIIELVRMQCLRIVVLATYYIFYLYCLPQCLVTCHVYCLILFYRMHLGVCILFSLQYLSSVAYCQHHCLLTVCLFVSYFSFCLSILRFTLTLPTICGPYYCLPAYASSYRSACLSLPPSYLTVWLSVAWVQVSSLCRVPLCRAAPKVRGAATARSTPRAGRGTERAPWLRGL